MVSIVNGDGAWILYREKKQIILFGGELKKKKKKPPRFAVKYMPGCEQSTTDENVQNQL